MDNLQSLTYQTFERDPVKYRNYEEVSEKYKGRLRRNVLTDNTWSQAVFRALSEWSKPGKM